MEILNEHQIFSLTSETCQILIKRSAELIMKDTWHKEQKLFSGVIEQVGLAANYPHQPVDVQIVLTNGTTESLPILQMSQITLS